MLLKFARDRNLYRAMLRDRAQAHAVSVLGYNLTCNHVHLLVSAADRSAIAEMMHDLAGEFAKAYNRRKRRKNAFWGERYHATLVEGRAHLWACMRYIDLNMVRAGVVVHPREWGWCGYQELSGLRRRYRLVDRDGLLCALEMGDDWEGIVAAYEQDVADRIRRDQLQREWEWTESLAVGSQAFVEDPPCRTCVNVWRTLRAGPA